MMLHELPGDWALPALTPWTHQWFTSGQFAVQRCVGCAHRQHPPEEVCARCGGMSFGYDVLGSRGTLHSYTIVHHAVHVALAPVVPYAVVLVSLDDDPRIRVVGNLVDIDRQAVTIGMALVADWVDRVADNGDVMSLPIWRAA